MDFSRLIEESNVDMLVAQMVNAVREFNINHEIIARNASRIIPRFLDEINCSLKHSEPLLRFLECDPVAPPSPPKREEAKKNKKRSKKKQRSALIPSPPPVDASSPGFCTFCKNNGVEPSIYKSHVIKDPITKKVTCPTLRNYTCPYCQNKDKDYAHTKSHCPKWAADQEAINSSKS